MVCGWDNIRRGHRHLYLFRKGMLTKGRAIVFVKFSLTELYLPTVMTVLCKKQMNTYCQSLLNSNKFTRLSSFRTAISR